MSLIVTYRNRGELSENITTSPIPAGVAIHERCQLGWSFMKAASLEPPCNSQADPPKLAFSPQQVPTTVTPGSAW